MDITSIGDDASGGDPLVCATQLTPCCASMGQRFGEWYYPNTTRVPVNITFDTLNRFYRFRRDSTANLLGGALLNRRFDALDPTGVFSCIIPDADGVYQTLYVGLYTSANNGKI